MEIPRESNWMIVTVITPFYEGRQYMPEYIKCMKANCAALQEAGHELQVIVVNDSPWDALELEESFIQVLENPANQGIHLSRVNRLERAADQYIMFLDQDDLIGDRALKELVEAAIGEAVSTSSECLDCANFPDVVVNAALQQSDGSYLNWYRTDEQQGLGRGYFYIYKSRNSDYFTRPLPDKKKFNSTVFEGTYSWEK